MSTKQTTDQSTKFDPGSMAAFQQATPAWMQPAQGYAQSPFSNPFFQTQQQLGTRQAQNLGGMATGNVTRNLTASGLFGGGSQSPAGLEMLQNQGRANTGLQSQLGFLNPLQNALALQQNAMGLLQGYRPLQTGGTTVQSTGGLGTWLPQLAGGALGMATGGGFGALGKMFGGGGSNFNYGGANASPMGFSQPSGGGGLGPWGDYSGGMSGPPPFMGGMPTPGAGGGDWFGSGTPGTVPSQYGGGG
jgi:hypothetical protein